MFVFRVLDYLCQLFVERLILTVITLRCHVGFYYMSFFDFGITKLHMLSFKRLSEVILRPKSTHILPVLDSVSILLIENFSSLHGSVSDFWKCFCFLSVLLLNVPAYKLHRKARLKRDRSHSHLLHFRRIICMETWRMTILKFLFMRKYKIKGTDFISLNYLLTGELPRGSVEWTNLSKYLQKTFQFVM